MLLDVVIGASSNMALAAEHDLWRRYFPDLQGFRVEIQLEWKIFPCRLVVVQILEESSTNG
jgi:hypothetical protein